MATVSDLEERLATAMAAAQRGDAGAYDRLLRQCVGVVTATARANGVPPDAIDDVVQDALLTVHRVRQTYDPRRPFLPWLRAIAQRRAIDALRRGGRRKLREVYDPLGYDSHADPEPDASERVDRADRARRLANIIRTLPDGQRQAVEHLGLREQSLDEASAETGRTTGALKVNLHRALKSLRSKLGPREDDV